MQLTPEQAKELMQKAVIERESFNFDTAEQMLNTAKIAFTEQNDLYNVSECLNHLAYSKKLRAKQILSEGHALAKESFELTSNNNLKQQSSLRCLISLLTPQERYEEELKVCNKLLELTSRPANKGDVLQHIAYSLLRTGKITEANLTIAQSLKMIEEGAKSEPESAINVWKSSSLITKALIEYNLGEIENAKKSAEEALKVAKSSVSKMRVKQAEAVLKLLNS